MSAAALLLIALLLHALTVAVDALNAEQQSLQRQNRELDLAATRADRYTRKSTRGRRYGAAIGDGAATSRRLVVCINANSPTSSTPVPTSSAYASSASST